MYGWYIIIVNAMEISIAIMGDGVWGRGVGPHMGPYGPVGPRSPPPPLREEVRNVPLIISHHFPIPGVE